MKKYLFYFLITISFSGIGQSSKSKNIRDHFPKFEEVLTYLDNNIKTGCDDCFFNIAKKPAGYFLQIKSNDKPYQVIEEVVIWSAESKRFNKIYIDSYLKSMESYSEYRNYFKSDEEFNEYLKSQKGLSGLKNKFYQYDFMLFYGYSGYSKDIIDLLDGESYLSIDDLEQLARAYDFNAGNCIHPAQWGSTPKFALNFKETNYKTIESFRVDKFLELADKSLSLYDKIIQRDRDFETFLIGNVELKRANNCMHYYNSLRSVIENQLANIYLEKAEFPDRYIELAKTFLDDISPNSILITHGDSDTYPLWYVQDQLGYRKDVAVLNSSLMSTTWFLKMNKEKYQLEMQLDLDACFENEIGYAVIVDDKSDKKNQVGTLINEFNNNILLSAEEGYILLNTGESYIVNYQDTMMDVKLKKQHLFLSDLALLDIIQNNPTKKIHFASSYNLSSFGWDNNYKQRMIGCELTPNAEIEKYDTFSRKLIEKNINNFKPDQFMKLGNFRLSILYGYYMYLRDLLEDQPDKAIILYDIIDSKLPDDLFLDEEKLLEIKYYINSLFKK